MKTLEVRICKRFKFCNSLSRYQCYMLTLHWRILEDPECELAGPFGTMPQKPWHPKRARDNAKPVPLSSHYREVRTSARWKSGVLWPPREIFLSLKANYHFLTYIKLYCHLSTLCLSAWSFVVFLLWMLCVSVTKNLRFITVGIKIWHKPDFWRQWTHSTFRKIIQNFKTKNINKL